ncbi:hypothetical protein WMY93_026397 [Mugilogobius chulae]|uniref:Uncharacterized protein n=1 Tax=Mugilogobius chulae TaxID=88201 RepID=A0AAW0N268_9GOBI
MTVTQDRPLTYSRMKGIVTFFSALLKGKKKKGGFTDFIHKLVSSQQLCQRSETQKLLRRQDRPRTEKCTLNSADHETALMKPSDFDYLKLIGKGSFGKVLLARHRTQGGYYAVKVLQKDLIVKRREQRHVMVERSVLLKGLEHPFLVGLHFSFQTPNTLYFVLDYVNGGELFFHLQREGSFPEARSSFYAAEMALALGYLHSLKIVYRDLKPENILLDRDGHVMLTDFGVSGPEVLLGQPYSPAVDWWSLGSVLFEMLFSLPPFYSQNKAAMFENILHAPLKVPSGASKAARSLLKGLLDRDVTARVGGSSDMAELQEHPFFAAIDWDDLLAKKIKPPFIPNVSGPCDVCYIDPEFTLQPVPASVNGRTQPGGATEVFHGFSYMNPAEMVS